MLPTSVVESPALTRSDRLEWEWWERSLRAGVPYRRLKRVRLMALLTPRVFLLARCTGCERWLPYECGYLDDVE